MSFWQILQTVLAVLLLAAILAQNRGAGLGSSWGSAGEFYVARRGVERLLFRITIVIACAFVLVSFANLLV